MCTLPLYCTFLIHFFVRKNCTLCTTNLIFLNFTFRIWRAKMLSPVVFRFISITNWLNLISFLTFSTAPPCEYVSQGSYLGLSFTHNLWVLEPLKLNYGLWKSYSDNFHFIPFQKKRTNYLANDNKLFIQRNITGYQV